RDLAVRTLINLFSSIPGSESTRKPVLEDSIAWARQEKRIFLKQSLETRLVALHLEAQSYRPALSLIDGLPKELKRPDDKLILTEVHLLESRVYSGLIRAPYAPPKDDNRDAGPSALPGSEFDSDHDTSSGAFPPSAKLREKLKKLANQRLDLSSIQFVNGAPEFHGNYATVSRGLLVSPSAGQDRTSESNPTKKDGLYLPSGPAGGASWQQKLTLREAEFLVELSHENVIELEGFVEDVSKKVVWLVFPWAENGNLKIFIASAEWEIPERVWL
ncbi:26S proteasome regulatory subunit rpn6, partial [Tulasnella sp. 425]